MAWECQRLLLFIIYLDDQGNDADDQNTELKQVGIGHHAITPLQCSGGGKKFRPPPEEGASRLPNTGSASAYPCAEDIIARFVEFGKVRNCLPPRVGKAEENPRRGTNRHVAALLAMTENWGLTFFHIMLY